MVALAALLLAPGAYAQAPAETTYEGEAQVVGEVIGGELEAGAAPSAERAPGVLAFTGFDVGLLALGAVVLAGTGAGLARWVARSQDP